VEPLAWELLLWRLHASLVAALDGLGDERVALERQAATERLMAVAETLNDGKARARFLSGRDVAKLLA
jgi:hypothetical protein